ncbi:hypothetical protein GGR58DRAFT_526285 [Xylaria digitata]|nr:hypothetical protein GGR58DRAFT_526285 [Xylaria digitata]
MSSLPSTSSFAIGVVAMAVVVAADDTFAESASSGSISNAIILLVAFVCTIGAGVIGYAIYILIRGRPNHVRITDVEEGAVEQAIPLQDVEPVRNRGTSHGTSNPQSSVGGLHSHQTNQHSMALSSNPPTQADLNTARGTRSYGSTQGTVPAAMAGHSAQGIHEQLPRGRDRARRRYESQRYDLGRRRQGKVLESPEELSEPPLSPVASPEVQTAPEAQSEYHQGQKQKMPISEFSPSGTTKGESSKPDIAESTSSDAFKLVKSRSYPSLTTSNFESSGDGIHDHSDQPLLSSRKDNQGGDNKGHAQDGKNDGSRGNVSGAVDMYGKKNKSPGYPKSNQGAQQSGNKDMPQPVSDPGNQYACLDRDYTQMSLVPAPLTFNKPNRTKTVHEMSSPVASTSASATVPHKVRPASTADINHSPIDPDPVDPDLADPEIKTSRPGSFMIQKWPPSNSDSFRWYIAPSEEIIEESRQAREISEYKAKAKEIILQRAKDTHEKLTDEELETRVRRMYERSSLYKLQATTYQRPASPPLSRRASTVSPPDHVRVRPHRHSRPSSLQPAANLGSSLTQSGLAFASSQALPYPATEEPTAAQEASSPTTASSSPASTRHGRNSYFDY